MMKAPLLRTAGTRFYKDLQQFLNDKCSLAAANNKDQDLFFEECQQDLLTPQFERANSNRTSRVKGMNMKTLHCTLLICSLPTMDSGSSPRMLW